MISVRRLAVTWSAGLLLGTLAIGVTSPLIVRSYLPQQLDPLRRCYVPAPGYRYRWRSEGYATTVMGAHGMPGRQEVPARVPGSTRVALWGDSQAEGVCVADEEKLFAQIERVADANGKRIVVLPLARSGEDASQWLTQIPLVERALDIDVHLVVIVELDDLQAAIRVPLPSVRDERKRKSQSKIAVIVPAFLIQTVRYLVTDEAGDRRHLRFGVGPAKQQDSAPSTGIGRDVNGGADWQPAMQTIRGSSDRPIVILYAPRSPHIFDGKIVLRDWHDERFRNMQRAAVNVGLLVVDARDVLADSARDGRWPHGFQNGQIGNGHLNATGYRVIAGKVAGRLP